MIVKRSAKHHITMFLPSFRLEDFFCKCNNGCEDQKINLKGAVMLQAVRDYLQRPVNITSSYRCPKHNKAVGGHPQSSHMEGDAFDVYVTGMSGFELALAGWKVGFRCIGISQNWCHLGADKPKSGNYDFWVYPPLDLAETKARFLRDSGYNGLWEGK